MSGGQRFPWNSRPCLKMPPVIGSSSIGATPYRYVKSLSYRFELLMWRVARLNEIRFSWDNYNAECAGCTEHELTPNFGDERGQAAAI
jgi:hypothetical protein